MIRKWKQFKFILPRENDNFTFEEVLGSVNQYSLQLFLPLLTKNDIIIDLGAHIGLFSIAVSDKVKKVISVEPDLENYEILNTNIDKNNIKNIKTLNKAAWKDDGTIKFYKSMITPARHSAYINNIFNDNNNQSLETTIYTISLETLFTENNIEFCKLLKMDIEGSEYEVLLNCPKHILKKIGILLIDYHSPINNYSINNLIDFFKNLNFSVTKGNEFEMEKDNEKLFCGNIMVINN